MSKPYVFVIWLWKYTFYTPAIHHATLKNIVFKARTSYKFANYLNKKKKTEQSFSTYPPPIPDDIQQLCPVRNNIISDHILCNGAF